jgi:hypothetical protein
MSLARTVKAKFNLDQLAAAAERKGFHVTKGNKNIEIRKVDGQSSRWEAITVTEDQLTYDEDYQVSIEKSLSKILPEYYGDAAENAGFTVEEQTETKDEIILRIGR